jgi:hypothetical protein
MQRLNIKAGKQRERTNWKHESRKGKLKAERANWKPKGQTESWKGKLETGMQTMEKLETTYFLVPGLRMCDMRWWWKKLVSNHAAKHLS